MLRNVEAHRYPLLPFVQRKHADQCYYLSLKGASLRRPYIPAILQRPSEDFQPTIIQNLF
jgi:hypothetical protein